jgi:putative sigma-54 modulation protein
MQVANINLPIKVTGRHVSVTEPIKEYAVKKVEGLHLDYPRIIEAQIILDVQKYRHLAEVILHCANHITIEATAESTDLYASLDEVMAKIAQQMRKYKTRIMRQHRPRHGEIQHVQKHILDIEGFEEHEMVPSVLQTEKYSVKPMFLDEAVLQLEVSDRPLVVFTNAETNKINVVYRRKDKRVGLIEPTVA